MDCLWRDSTWSTGSGHSVSQPIMMQRRSGSFPGSDAPSMLSPRSSDTGGVGFKMVEYVLGSSPTTKELESRMNRLQISLDPNDTSNHHHHHQDKKKIKDYEDGGKVGKENTGRDCIQANGMIPNGIDGEDGNGGVASGAGPGSSVTPGGVAGPGGPSSVAGKIFNRAPGNHQSDEDQIKGSVLVNDVGKMVKPDVDDLSVSSGGAGLTAGSGVGSVFQGHSFDSHFESPMGMDPLQFDYASHLIPSALESPGILEFNSQLYSQRTNQPNQGQVNQMLHQQQYSQSAMAAAAAAAAAAQQQQQQQQQGLQQHPSTGMGPPPPQPGQPGAGTNHFPQNTYYQDPFAAQMGHLIPAGPPPTMMQPYYGLPPWGMYPGMIQGGQGQHPQAPPPPPPPHVQQQQMMAQRNGQRPLTPQGPNDNSGNPPGSGLPPPPQGQYKMMTPHGYYDQNGSLIMGGSAAAAAARNMSSTMRLLPQMLINPAHNQGPNSNIRMMPGQGQTGLGNHSGPNPLFSSSASNVNNNPLYTSETNSGLGYPNSAVTSSNLANGSHSLGYNPNMTPNVGQGGYGNSALGPIGASLASGINLGNSSPRRESFDGRRPENSIGGGIFSTNLDGNQFSRHLSGKSGQFYGHLGNTIGASPGPGPIGLLPPNQSLTPPPPTMNGSNGNLNLGTLGANRMVSAAPGAEAKYLVRNGPMNGSIFGSSNSVGFSNRLLQRNSSMDKSTGRSRLLEDFRNNRYPNLQLRDLTDHIVEFSQDQHGSRFIQQKLERTTAADKQLVFNEIIAHAYNLMTDVFGNYVIQKFFEFGTPEQKQALAMKVKGHVLPLALQMYGCRVIQKALESISPEQQKEIVKELDGHVLKCVKDQNGNHVVQKCIECVDPHALQFIIGAFQGQVYSLSTHPYGCRVIQRILEHCTPEQTTPILEELHQHTEQLVQDQYGNYVVQHVLEHGRPEDKSRIISTVRGKVMNLSMHKFASNVVEKCVTHANRNERALLIEEVCSYNDSALYTMMKDQFANYVVQKMIEVAEQPQRKSLLNRIRPHLPALRKYTYGKHILAKLEKFMPKNNDLGPIGAPSNGAIP